MAASQGDDGIGAANRPEHSRLFEAGTNYGLASSLNHTGANEQMLTAELGIAHTLGVPVEVNRLDAKLVGDLGIGGFDGPQRADQLFDLPVVKPVLLDHD